MLPYTLKIPANTEEPIYFGNGRNYIRVDESVTVAVTIKSPENNEEVTLEAGGDATLTSFDELRFSHDGAADTLIKIYIGKNTKMDSARIGGSVQVTGGSNNTASPPVVDAIGGANNTLNPPVTRHRAETQSGNTYISIGSNNTAITWPAVQLFNPVGSGVNLIISRFGIAFGSAFAAHVYRDAALRGIADTKPVYNKLGVIADGTNKGKIYLADEAALRSPTFDIFGGGSSNDNLLPEIGALSNNYTIGGRKTNSQYPYILTPGSGIQLLILSAGANLYYLAEWQEVAP